MGVKLLFQCQHQSQSLESELNLLYYFLEEYPKCVESYHQAMLIRPTEVRGETLYNMGTAYAEMERYKDAVKCFEQAIPRGLSDEAKRRAKDQIRRCNILQKAMDKKRKKR